MILKILKWLLAIIVLLTIGSLFISNEYYQERTILIKAPVAVVFDQLNILKNHEGWDPWKKADSTLKLTYNEIPAGTGASYEWNGEGKFSGKGKMTITGSIPNQKITYDLIFNGQGGATTGQKLEQVGDSVKVVWYFKSEMGWNPIHKYGSLLFSGIMNDMFDGGLNDLKTICESMPATPLTSEYKVQQMELKTAIPYLGIRTKATGETISAEIGKCYGMIGEVMKKQGLNYHAEFRPFATYYAWENNNFDFEACIPTDKAGKTDGDIKAGEMPAGNYLFTSYFGNYEGTANAHKALQNYAAANSIKIKMAATEVYVNDPMVEKDTAKWQTDIYYAIE